MFYVKNVSLFYCHKCVKMLCVKIDCMCQTHFLISGCFLPVVEKGENGPSRERRRLLEVRGW